MTDTANPAAPDRRRQILIALGAALHVGVGVFPLSASGLLAPGWAVGALYAAWAGLAVGAWQARHRYPWALAAAAVAMVGVWFAVLSAGEALLGWTA